MNKPTTNEKINHYVLQFIMILQALTHILTFDYWYWNYNKSPKWYKYLSNIFIIYTGKYLREYGRNHLKE